ncbi:MAG: metal-dependent hydrolase [Archangium sp.]
MASIGHLAVGMAAARLYSRRVEPSVRPGWTMVLMAALSMVPDLDVVGFKLGIEYSDPLGHRGVTHSLLFALTCSVIALAFAKPLKVRPWPLFALVFVVLLQHPLLDMLTDGGLGCAFFFPSNHRYFFPFTPIPVAPIGRAFLSARGLLVMGTEAVMFAPFALYALWPRKSKPAASSAKSSAAL